VNGKIFGIGQSISAITKAVSGTGAGRTFGLHLA